MEVDLNKMTISEIEEYLKEIKGKFVSLQEFRDLGDSDEKLKKVNSILLASGVPERYLLSELIYGGQDFYDLELDITKIATEVDYLKSVLNEDIIKILKFTDNISSLQEGLELSSISENTSTCYDCRAEYTVEMKSEEPNRKYRIWVFFENDVEDDHGRISLIDVCFETAYVNLDDIDNSYCIYNEENEMVFDIYPDEYYSIRDSVEEIVSEMNMKISEFKEELARRLEAM